MKTLDEVIDALEICSRMDAECDKCPYKSTAKGWCEEKDRDALHYLKQYKADLDKKCSNCKNWHGHKNYDRNDPWREEYYCEYETWTYPEDSCSKWKEML